MKRFYLYPLVFLVVGLLVSCAERKDDSLDRALFNYIVFCPGGSVAACQAGCREQFGENVTTENFSGVDSCLSRCQTNCNIQNILLLTEAAN